MAGKTNFLSVAIYIYIYNIHFQNSKQLNKKNNLYKNKVVYSLSVISTSAEEILYTKYDNTVTNGERIPDHTSKLLLSIQHILYYIHILSKKRFQHEQKVPK